MSQKDDIATLVKKLRGETAMFYEVKAADVIEALQAECAGVREENRLLREALLKAAGDKILEGKQGWSGFPKQRRVE